MSINHAFRKKSYLGKVVYLDMNTKDIIATGHGQFNVDAMSMNVSLTAHVAGRFRRIMVILLTSEGYVAPFVTYRQTLLLNMPIDTTYEMSAYLRWPSNTDILSITRQFSSIDIIVQAQHSKDSVQSRLYEGGITTRLGLRATASQLGQAAHKGISIELSAGYTLHRGNQTSRSRYQANLDTYMKYHFRKLGAEAGFRIGDIGRALLAFKLYWITNHDMTDCTISTIKLGDFMTLTLADNKLHARSMTAGVYRAVPVIQTRQNVDDLAKMAHFFFNPQRRRTLSPSSKAGLAFVRIIDHRFKVKGAIFDMDIASLIFALQSLSESIAESEIKKQNKATARETREGVRRVLEQITSIEDTLPAVVASFYQRSENEIYNAVARPTFMQSLEVSLEKLDIDIKKYRTMLRSIDKARRQVVHSEGYNVDFLLNLLAHSAVRTKVGSDGLARSVIVTKGVSSIDKLYLLLREMIRSYFNQYGH